MKAYRLKKSCELISCFRIILALLVSISLSSLLYACDNKRLVGALTGSQIGGYLGSTLGSGPEKILYRGLGSIAGASIGAKIGQELDRNDEIKAQKTQYETLEYSDPDKKSSKSSWENLETGNRGEVITGEVFEVNQQKCRKYTHTIYVDEKPEVISGTACRNQDGTWNIS